MRSSSPTPAWLSRWEAIIRLLEPDTSNVLDIGCRDRELERHLPEGSRYTGLDLYPPADIVASAEEPLPFESGAFSAAVLADVLEHLENPHLALDEAMRVSARSVVVILPNIYTLFLRIRHLAGQPLGKYEFGPDEVVDRHRWVLNFDQAVSFTRGRAARAGWRVAKEYGLIPLRRRSARLVYGAARVAAGPNLWAWAYVARLEPDRG